MTVSTSMKSMILIIHRTNPAGAVRSCYASVVPIEHVIQIQLIHGSFAMVPYRAAKFIRSIDDNHTRKLVLIPPRENGVCSVSETETSASNS